MAVILKFQSTGSIPGDGAPVPMRGESLTMGRGAENDLCLPDPDRVLSKRHCAIEDHNGNVVVVDISTNGTFLNYGKLPLGPTPTPLNDGDILSVGPYEILISIASKEEADLLPDPMADAPVSHGDALSAPSPSDLLDAPGDGGDFLDDLLGDKQGLVGPSGVDRAEPDDDGLLPPLGDESDILAPADDPFAIQGASVASHNPSAQDSFSAPRAVSAPSLIPDDWDDDLLQPAPLTPGGGPAGNPFGAPPPTPPNVSQPPQDTSFTQPTAPISEPPRDITQAPFQVTTPANTPPAQPVAAPTPAPAAPAPAAVAPEPAPQPTAAPSAASGDLAQSFLEALGAEDIDIKEKDIVPTVTRMGEVLRIMIEGLREILMTRTSIKQEFRIERTMIQAGGNNPLKFSISPEQAVEAMLKPKARGYLAATEATREALNDIKAHEVAMMTGMEAALKGVLKKLDPLVLEKKIAKEGGISSLLKSRKARYWEIYEDMYAEISDQAENDFQELFAKEFARAYQAQLEKLK